jgi:hypothetical protein
MFIAYGPRQGSHPSGVTCSLAVASSITIPHSRRRRIQKLLQTFFVTMHRPKHFTPLGEESFGRFPSYKHVTPPE